jgi:hypothetical protein
MASPTNDRGGRNAASDRARNTVAGNITSAKNANIESTAGMRVMGIPKELVPVVSETAWMQCLQELQEIPALSQLCPDMENSPERWLRWLVDEHPEVLDPPGPLLQPLHKLLVVKTLRPDRLAHALQLMLRHYMGDKYVDVGTIDVEATCRRGRNGAFAVSYDLFLCLHMIYFCVFI